MKIFLKLTIVLFFIICLTVVFSIFKYKDLLTSPIGGSAVKKVFEIEDGMTGDLVLSKLETEGIINSLQKTSLKIYIRTINPKFLKGTYKIPMNISPMEIIEVLQNPELTDIWITIPEGLRKDEIAKIIADEYKGVDGAVFSQKEFLSLTKDSTFIESLSLGVKTKDLEGFLFPDKYLMPAQATTEYVVQTLTNTFKTKIGDITYKQLVIASMIEREGINNTDRPLISDVIYKRLSEGWLLQIDATLLYPYKDWKHVITFEDKKVDNPYNTYLKPGLPPTPICNPGLSSINAAKYPKANQYYYYIHANGNVYFARTLAEHEANIAKYLR